MNFSEIYLFSDIDGTLGVAGKGIPARNYGAIRRFVEQGGHFGLCTGRWITDITHFVQGLPINSLSIINNGAALYDFAAGKCLRSTALPEQAMAYVQEIRALDERMTVLAVNASGYYGLSEEGGECEALSQRMQVIRPSDFPGPFLKFLFLCPKDTREEVLRRAQEMHHPGVYYTLSGESFEMIPEGVSKGAGLKRLCAEADIPLEKTFFIGDNYNDREMFLTAGTSACVAETPGDLAALCDVQVGRCMDGAVADFIEWLETAV